MNKIAAAHPRSQCNLTTCSATSLIRSLPQACQFLTVEHSLSLNNYHCCIMNDNNLRWSLTKSFHYFIHPNGTLPTWCALLRDHGYVMVLLIVSHSLDHSSHGGKTLSVLLCTEWRQPVDLFLTIGFVGGAKCCLQIYPLQLLRLFQARTWPQPEHQNPSSHHHRCYQKNQWCVW